MDQETKDLLQQILAAETLILAGLIAQNKGHRQIVAGSNLLTDARK